MKRDTAVQKKVNLLCAITWQETDLEKSAGITTSLSLGNNVISIGLPTWETNFFSELWKENLAFIFDVVCLWLSDHVKKLKFLETGLATGPKPAVSSASDRYIVKF